MEFGKFKDIKYERPNFKELKKEMNSLNKTLKNAKSYEEFRDAYLEYQEKMKHVSTMLSISSIRNTIDTNDKFYEDEEKYLNSASGTVAMASLKLTKTIVNCPFKKEINEEFGPILLQTLENNQKLMSMKIIFLMIKEGTLSQKYSKVVANAKVDFKGEECNFYGLLKHMQSTDREERKEAFNKWADLYESISGELDDLYTGLVNLRVKTAKKLKFDSFIDYVYLQRGRYDYKAKDVEVFREEVRKYIVPICERLYNEQKEDLGIDQLHFYDEELTFKDGNPVPMGDTATLVKKAQEMYHGLSKETGEYFDFMVEHELFDLETRKGKHMGGYCTYLPDYAAPFIFSNFNGTSADVDVLTHEAGHAFQGYLGFRNIKVMSEVSSTSEINEIHSMTMEHFTYPFMELFFLDKADKYRYHHLVKSLEVIPYLVSVDEFQHRIFENPTMSPMDRRQVWHDIEKKYMPWRDYDGNKFLSEGGFWMQKQHIFLYPFYYVDYALAATCAYQLFLRSLDNKEEAWNDYMHLCLAGGTKGYFDLLEVANLKNPFKEGTVKDIALRIEEVIKDFKAKL